MEGEKKHYVFICTEDLTKSYFFVTYLPSGLWSCLYEEAEQALKLLQQISVIL